MLTFIVDNVGNNIKSKTSAAFHQAQIEIVHHQIQRIECNLSVDTLEIAA